MSTRFRSMWSRLSRMKFNYRSVAIVSSYKFPTSQLVPYALSFSMFTWLGFDKKLSAEDELIDTIKHCILFIQRTEYDKAEQLLHVALRQAQQIRHQLGITYIYDVMANLALEREQLEKAKTLFVNVSQRIMANGATEDDPNVVHISLKLARISHLQKNYSTAQLGYDWCLEKLKKLLDKDPTDDIKKLIAMAEDWYGRLFLDCGKTEHALNYMIKALNTMKEIPVVEQEHIVVQINDIGTVCDILDRDDESISYFKEAISMGEKLGMDEVGGMYVNLGRVYLKKRMFDAARKNCGYGWKLGVNAKNDDIKQEAELCLKELKELG